MVVNSSPASNTNLVTADFDQVGDAIDDPTEGAPRVDVSSITTGQYTNHTLNSTGESWINKTGITKLGMREGHDVLDNPISGEVGVEIKYAEWSGTSQDPKLVIEHHTSNHSPEASQLQTEGVTNPVNVTDTTPEFSAVYLDEDSGDLATAFQLQVSTSSSIWTGPVWDSGKTTMATTTESTRSPEISFGGTPLDTDGTTYYWRIKFWDDDDAEGSWSTSTASFTMAIWSGSSAVAKYIHTDHLGGTHVVTDSDGNMVELNDYYPFGELRLDEGTFDEQRKYTSHEYDGETDLTYANARYYNQDIGRFLSQDPVFQDMGVDDRTELVLKDPQLANSYSYTRNNPVALADNSGEFPDILVDAGFALYSGYQLGKAIFTGGDVKGEAINFSLDLGGALIPGVVGAGTIRRLDNAADAAKGIKQFDAAAQQKKMLQGVENSKAANVIKDTFKTTDTIPGGTMGAIRNEILTGEKTKGTFHFGKAQNTSNRINNILNKENLNKIETNRLQGIKNSLDSLRKSIDK